MYERELLGWYEIIARTFASALMEENSFTEEEAHKLLLSVADRMGGFIVKVLSREINRD